MKSFITLKVGYSVGAYGCSGEIFTTIITKDKKQYAVSFEGLYGAEERINRLLKEGGYNEFYVQSFFGKMTRKDKTSNIHNEQDAYNLIKHFIETGKITSIDELEN